MIIDGLPPRPDDWGLSRHGECRSLVEGGGQATGFDMAYYSQVSSRFEARLLAALMFALTAFGVAGPGAASISQPVVWARQKLRRAPQRLPEQHESACAPPLVRIANSRRDAPPPAISFLRWAFQRPPPSALLLHE